METNIKVTGTVKLEKKDLLTAIDEYLATRFDNLKVRRIQYSSDMDSVLCEVHKEMVDDKKLTMKFLPHAARKGREGYKKKYLGFFDAARNIFTEQRKQKRKEISLDDFVAEIQGEFPTIEKTRVAQYLHDKRQLKGINYDSKGGLIRL